MITSNTIIHISISQLQILKGEIEYMPLKSKGSTFVVRINPNIDNIK